MVPYQGMVASDPSFDDMRRLVCDDNRRPEIPKEIETHLVRIKWAQYWQLLVLTHFIHTISRNCQTLSKKRGLEIQKLAYQHFVSRNR